MKNFGQKLYDLRIKNGYTLDGLAKAINREKGTSLTKGMLSKWENGKVDPSFQKVVPLADFFHVTMDWFLGLESEEKSSTTNKFSTVNAKIIGKIREDSDLIEALKIYFSLPESKKKYIIETIRMISR